MGAQMNLTQVQPCIVGKIRWCPGHQGILGNERADTAAKQATTDTSTPRLSAGERVRELKSVLQLMDKYRKKNPREPSSNTGQYTWKLDKALPGKHTLTLYSKFNSDGASILAQAWTGHNGLNYYLHQRRLRDTPSCDCGRGEETMWHVLLSAKDGQSIGRF